MPAARWPAAGYRTLHPCPPGRAIRAKTRIPARRRSRRFSGTYGWRGSHPQPGCRMAPHAIRIFAPPYDAIAARLVPGRRHPLPTANRKLRASWRPAMWGMSAIPYDAAGFILVEPQLDVTANEVPGLRIAAADGPPDLPRQRIRGPLVVPRRVAQKRIQIAGGRVADPQYRGSGGVGQHNIPRPDRSRLSRTACRNRASLGTASPGNRRMPSRNPPPWRPGLPRRRAASALLALRPG